MFGVFLEEGKEKMSSVKHLAFNKTLFWFTCSTQVRCLSNINPKYQTLEVDGIILFDIDIKGQCLFLI